MPIITEKRLWQDKKLKVVAFGNSITATRNTIHQVYAQRLPQILAKKGVMAEVINAGVPGSHTGSINDHSLFKIQHGLDRFDSDVLAHHPDLVIIGFGTNDAHIDGSDPKGPSRIPVKDYENNLTFMIKTLQENQIKVILLAPNTLGKKFPGYQNERLRLYVNTVRTLSKTYQTGLVDNFKLFMDFQKNTGNPIDDLLLDGVHPNDVGHQLMAEEMGQEIIHIMK
ncbi:MAG: GDSL-type esterase/lipase family protein [Cyclobacteriaceae bacterium]